MARRVELEKNVPKTLIDDIEDIKWSLKCTNEHMKSIATNMDKLELRMDSFEEDVLMIEIIAEDVQT